MRSGIWSTSLVNLLTLQTKGIPKTSPMLVLSPPTRSHIYQEVKWDFSHPLALLRYLCSIRMQPSSARHLSPYPASGGPKAGLWPYHLFILPASVKKPLLQKSTDIVVLLPPSHLRGNSKRRHVAQQDAGVPLPPEAGPAAGSRQPVTPLQRSSWWELLGESRILDPRENWCCPWNWECVNLHM